MGGGAALHMMLRIYGAIFIIAAGWLSGIVYTAALRRETQNLKALLDSVGEMECELQYRLTPLPALCKQASEHTRGIVATVLCALGEEMERQIAPDVDSCMHAVLQAHPMSEAMDRVFRAMGSNLGRYDVAGQLKGLEYTRALCTQQLEHLTANQDNRIRSCRTLGVCAGMALAILLI